MKKRIGVKIYGTVQGVGFRFSAVRKAEELELTGFVRNCDDGSLETEAQGEEEAVGKYAAWCRKGPTFSQVMKAEERLLKLKGEESRFDIR